MGDNKYACEECKMRLKYEKNPESLIARFWHWHTRFCPGWKAYYNSRSAEGKEMLKIKYNLK